MDIFIAGVKQTFENTSFMLPTTRKYQVPSKLPTKIYIIVSAFPRSLQTNAELVP